MHEHSIYSSSVDFIIDPESRLITNTRSKIKLAQYDHLSTTFAFECPRYVNGHDMSLCDKVYVYYVNAGRDESQISDGVYKTKDLIVSKHDPSKINFSWPVSGDATEYAGKLSFIVRFSCHNENSDYAYIWNTAEHSTIFILSGYDGGEIIVERHLDILDMFDKRISKFESVEVIKSVNGAKPDENGNVTVSVMPDDLEQLSMLIKTDLLPAVHDTSEAILTDENGNIILRY